MRKSAAFVLTALADSTALAHERATGIVGDRMKAMTNMGRELKVIGDMLLGTVPFDGDAVRKTPMFFTQTATMSKECFRPAASIT